MGLAAAANVRRPLPKNRADWVTQDPPGPVYKGGAGRGRLSQKVNTININNHERLNNMHDFSRFYNAWNQEIEEKCNNNVLLFNVADGWGPLCDYLDCPVPKQKFPRQVKHLKLAKYREEHFWPGRLNDSAALVRHRKYIAFLISLFFVVMFCMVLLFLWAFS